MSSTALGYRARRKNISLTALIDVVFILLMFFMLTSSFNRWRAMDFIAPVAGSDTKPSTPNLIELDASGRLRLLNGEFSITHFDQLQTEHIEYFQKHPSSVLLTASDVTLQQIIATMEALKTIGVESLNLGGIVDTNLVPHGEKF